jgi:hypothetical protein
VRQCRCVQAAAPSGARGNQGCTTAPPAGFAQSRADFCNKICQKRSWRTGWLVKLARDVSGYVAEVKLRVADPSPSLSLTTYMS